MDNIPKVKMVVAICMILALTAVIAISLFADIALPMRVAVIGSSIYGFYEIDKWIKK